MSEIKRYMESVFDSYEIEIRLLDEVIHRVREKHIPFTHVYGKIACKEDGQNYPCGTIKILDGEIDE